MNPTSAPYRFHAFDPSYFSAKVRPALRYKQLWYEELRADIAEIHRRTGMSFIPVVVTPGDETWQDSTEIFDHLEKCHPSPPLFPQSPVQRMAAHLIELYVDEFGTIPAMHYRWGTKEREASTRARFAAMLGSRELGDGAADAMVSRKSSLGITEDAAPAIEAHTRDLLDALSAHFESQAYLLGDRMCFADCALMGLLYGHLFNDLASRRLLLETAIPVVGWIERTNVPNTDRQGEWLPDDALAPGLVDVLGVMGRDAAPVILDGVRAVEAWADDHRGGSDRLLRAAGEHESSLRDRPLRKMAVVYTLWMLQRTIDRYRSFDDDARRRVDAAVAGTGWETVLAYEPRHRLTKRDFELVFE